MNRLIRSLGLVALTALQVQGVANNCTLSSWTVGGSISLDTTNCSLATVTAALNVGAGGVDCLTQLYGANYAANVTQLCASMEDTFGSITNTPIDYHNDKNYMDGGTLLNYGNQAKPDESLGVVGGNIGRYLSSRVNKARITVPKYFSVSDSGYDATGYMSNFHLTKSCALRTAMCCFVGSIKNSTIPKNADVCNLDISKSKNSSHVRRGAARYDIPGKDAYCVGFSWSADPNSISNKYKGNMLVAASVAQTYVSGYVGNIPGAPMCACIEQMPTVTASDCISVDATETAVTLVFKGTNTTTNGGYSPLVAQLSTTVTYGTCGANSNSLKSQFATMSTAAEQAVMATRIVNDCNVSTAQLMADQNFVTASTKKYQGADLSKWTLVVGQGNLYSPMIGEDAFRSLMQLRPDGRYPLVYRYCCHCPWNSVAKNIYYRRNATRPYPLTQDFLNLFMSNWTSASNMIGLDFNLYSTYADALNQSNAWTFCNYDDPSGTVGFPRDCGPTGSNGGYWTSYAVNQQNDNTRLCSAYYVEK
mmetsp:Transcript_5133/g.7564  ORF Transcript_5133/g.7564 Transcript_5133/m.7564 type:complete len:533 (-) Transcript_5133:416-2014(-)